MVSLTNAQIRDLKARAQRLKATLKIGKEGISPQFLAALDHALRHHELVKVKFDGFKNVSENCSRRREEAENGALFGQESASSRRRLRHTGNFQTRSKAFSRNTSINERHMKTFGESNF